MGKRACGRRELIERWRLIMEEQDEDDPSPSKQRRIRRLKEEWFSDSFDLLVDLPKDVHIWCGYADLMGPLLETFHNFFEDKHKDSPLKLVWKRLSQEMRQCTQCVCQHHQAQEAYGLGYESDTVEPLLKILKSLDEERVMEHLKEINSKIGQREYDPDCHGAEVVSLMFEVLMFPILLDDLLLVNEFQIFIEAVDKSHEITLAGHEQYPGVYAMFFLKDGRARAIGLRLAGCLGKLRWATDLEPLQPLLRKYIGILETEGLPLTSDTLRPRMQLEKLTVWSGVKTLLGFLDPPAFEEGILERYPVFMSVVLNHVSDDTPEFSHAVTCLRASFEMLGCKLWLRTSLSPSMIRNTLLGQCFHTRNEKSHKEIFDLFLPLLQSLEALQDGEHEKQRRHFLYFLLHQVTQSNNFSLLMRKNARKIALLIVHRGYTMNPPCPPFECAHMWGPSLVSSLKDSSLHSSLRQPAFDLIIGIIVSDTSAITYLKLNSEAVSAVDSSISSDFVVDDDEVLLSHHIREKNSNCWREFSNQSKVTLAECKEWICIPMLWFEVLTEVDPAIFPVSFCKAVFWVMSHISVMEANLSLEFAMPINKWLSVYAPEISSSFGWEVPQGYDDGSDGKESRNSIKVSSMQSPLGRTLKRFAAEFIIQMEKRELHKQWTWEPEMAESLILLLIDPNENIRQINRVVLEHISKTRGLTPGLQFLCSSATSLSAVYLGLRHALKKVQADSVSANFHNFQHLLFITRKLLKEVVTSSKTSPGSSQEGPKSGKFVSEGGFLRQPCFDDLCVTPTECSFKAIDLESWEKFSCLLSIIIWPSLSRCLAEGRELVNSKSFQMTCVRLLETLPVVFERLSLSLSKLSGSPSLKNLYCFDYKWLSDLVDWGKSSLIVVSRHWKQCISSLLTFLRDTGSGNPPYQIGAIEAIMSQDSIEVDVLREKVLHLSISLSREFSITSEKKMPKGKTLMSELSLGSSISNACSYGGKHADAAKDVNSHDIVVLSDEVQEKKALPDFNPVCSSKSGYSIPNNVLAPRSSNRVSPDHLSSSGSSRDIVEPFPSSNAVRDTQLSFQNKQHDKLFDDKPSHELEPSICENVSNSISKVVSEDKGLIGAYNSNKPVSPKDSHTVYKKLPAGPTLPSNRSSSIQTVSKGTPKTKLELAKEAAVIKDLICDVADDPLEHSLDHSRRPQSVLLTMPNISAPKRKIIQLHVPMNDKYGTSNKADTGGRKLKPAKLDDWYRPILEMDYFVTVGLSSSEVNKKIALNDLKEIPLSFHSPDHYVKIFRPLILEEFKAQLQNTYMETSSDDMWCCKFSVLSVEKIDDFHLVRGCPDDSEPAASGGCSENDLVLLTKEPLKSSVQQIHVLGKVERREKCNKSRSIALVIRFYLPSGSSRLIKVKTLLMERSKWTLTRIMSITPQLREFQALSSLHDIPILLTIIDPVSCSSAYSDVKKADLSKLSQSLQNTLRSSYNDSQLQAVSVAIRAQDSKHAHELSLVQGPPGTGKTKTIIGIVSASLAMHEAQKASASRIFSDSSISTAAAGNNLRTKLSQSSAIARAWQDAAFAKQMVKDAEREPSRSAARPAKGRVLICAQSNAAVDELVSRISEGLYGNDGKIYKPYMVRVGNAKTVHPNSMPFFIDTLVEQRLAEDTMNQNAKSDMGMASSSSLRAELERVMDCIRLYESKRAKLNDSDTHMQVSSDTASKENDGPGISDSAIGAKLNILYGQKKAICGELAAAQARERKFSEESRSLKHKIRKSILREAEIVVATLSGCGGDLYEVCSESASSNKFGSFSEQTLFDVVVIDEAAQALEPATLIPLQLLKSNRTRCIMVGDPKQLPATVLSNVASKFLYECSMFERLQRAGHPVVMLTEQYRMHPEICYFPSLHFYDNKLLNGSLMASKSASFHERANLGPYMFFDVTDGREHHGKNSGSLSVYNEPEAEAAVEILRVLRRRYPFEFSSLRIGVITPYRSQLSLLRSRFSNAFGPNIVSEMELNTVDGFQGREVDILVLSTVRASQTSAKPSTVSSSGIGFVADVRRMNVALTRARISLWIFGNAKKLETNLHWAALVKNAKERNLFVPVSRPYKSTFDKDLPSSRETSRSESTVRRSRHLEDHKMAESTCVKDEVTLRLEADVTKHTQVPPLSHLKGKHKTLRRKLCEGVLEQDPTSPVDMGSSLTRKMISDCEHEGKVSFKKKDKSANANDSSRRDSLCKITGTETMPDKSLEAEIDLKKPIEKARGARRLSADSSSVRSSQSTSAMPPHTVGSQKLEESSNSNAKPKDLVSARKRQRAAVEELLSSALLPSKKPETSSKLAPNRRR
ncbi:putative DNA helicase [Dioscorea sansibarensis]